MELVEGGGERVVIRTQGGAAGSFPGRPGGANKQQGRLNATHSLLEPIIAPKQGEGPSEIATCTYTRVPRKTSDRRTSLLNPPRCTWF